MESFVQYFGGNRGNTVWKQELMLSKFTFNISLVKLRSNYGQWMKKLKTNSWNNTFQGFKPEKVAVLSKWSFVNWRITVNQQITVKRQFTSCKLVVYKCKLAVYTCKVLNSRFTTVLVITLLDTVEVTPFFQIFFCKAVVYRCKLLLYYKPPLYKL